MIKKHTECTAQSFEALIRKFASTISPDFEILNCFKNGQFWSPKKWSKISSPNFFQKVIFSGFLSVCASKRFLLFLVVAFFGGPRDIRRRKTRKQSQREPQKQHKWKQTNKVFATTKRLVGANKQNAAGKQLVVRKNDIFLLQNSALKQNTVRYAAMGFWPKKHRKIPRYPSGLAPRAA